MSTFRSLCGSCAGSRIAVTLILPSADVDPVLARGHDAREPAVHAVVAQQVGVGLDGPRSLIATTSMSRAAVLDDGAQDKAADTAKAVDGDAKSHEVFLLTIGPGQRRPAFPDFAARFAGGGREVKPSAFNNARWNTAKGDFLTLLSPQRVAKLALIYMLHRMIGTRR
jgi:hypothetical protein